MHLSKRVNQYYVQGFFFREQTIRMRDKKLSHQQMLPYDRKLQLFECTQAIGIY